MRFSGTIMALFLAACGSPSPEAEWTRCLGEHRTMLGKYQTLYATAKGKVAELPAPDGTPTAIANRKIIDDAVVMVGGGITTFEAALNSVQAAVEPDLKGPRAADTVKTGCGRLALAGKQVAEKIASSGKAIQIYNELTAKTRWPR